FPLISLNCPAPTHISPLSLHDALPISGPVRRRSPTDQRRAGGRDRRATFRWRGGAGRILRRSCRSRKSAAGLFPERKRPAATRPDRKSTRLNSSHQIISYAVFCLKKKI